MAYQDEKEVNKHLMSTTTTTSADPAQTDHGFGNISDHSPLIPTSCNEEAVSLETTIPKDLNKFCCKQDSIVASSPNINSVPTEKVSIAKNTPNTDGDTHTLTVLNDGDQSDTRSISANNTSAENLVPNSLLSSQRQQSTTESNANKAYPKNSGGGRKGNSKSAASSHRVLSNTVRKKRFMLYCKFCRKGFKHKSTLERHIIIHTGQRPFACSECSWSFKRKHHLQGHYKNKHTCK